MINTNCSTTFREKFSVVIISEPFQWNKFRGRKNAWRSEQYGWTTHWFELISFILPYNWFHTDKIFPSNIQDNTFFKKKSSAILFFSSSRVEQMKRDRSINEKERKVLLNNLIEPMKRFLTTQRNRCYFQINANHFNSLNKTKIIAKVQSWLNHCQHRQIDHSLN